TNARFPINVLVTRQKISSRLVSGLTLRNEPSEAEHSRRGDAKRGVAAPPFDGEETMLLHLDGIFAGYGQVEILHGVSLAVRRGEMVSIIGPNGAGKSTVFKTIVGLLRAWSGRIAFDGHDINALQTDQVLRLGLAYVPQGRIVFPQMTVTENLEMGAYIERDPARVRAAQQRVYELFPILAERRKQKAGTLSGGEQQMVAI